MDPIGWLSSKGVHRIMLIGSPPEGDDRNEESYDYIRNRYNGEDNRIQVERGCIWARDNIGN